MNEISSYLDPKPGHQRRNHAASIKKSIDDKLSKHGKAGAHLDEMGDIYDHREIFDSRN